MSFKEIERSGNASVKFCFASSSNLSNFVILFLNIMVLKFSVGISISAILFVETLEIPS